MGNYKDSKTEVTGPGAITPDKDIKTASNKKAENNNFYSLVSVISADTPLQRLVPF